MLSNQQAHRIISAVFFLSGCSTLIFETVWFRVASVVLGSSVWSAAAVLTAFMAGMAIGNGLMAARGYRIKNLLRVYLLIEIVIGLLGVLVVVGLPAASPLLARALSPIADHAFVLQLARFFTALFFLALPAIAMGATLPLMQKLLHQYNREFHRSFGMLYGWNTLGAVCGTLMVELALISTFGVLGSAFVALSLNLLIITAMFQSFRGKLSALEPEPAQSRMLPAGMGLRVVFAAGLSGLLLLALEVIWFRYLLLTQAGTSLIFSVMLAVVLAGIGLGGLVVSRIKLDDRRTANLLVYLPLAAAAAVAAGYYAVYWNYSHDVSAATGTMSGFLVSALLLMFPTSLISGAIFTLYGHKLFSLMPATTRTSGTVTLANTTGAAIGAAIATFILLPVLGVEYSFVALAIAYILLALMMFEWGSPGRLGRSAVAGATACAVLLAFPYGLMRDFLSADTHNRYRNHDLIASSEGLTETARYMVSPRFGNVYNTRLVTNSYSMSGNTFVGDRYMRLYSYFPYIFRQDIGSALLISYGVGTTADAITKTPGVTSIDVVDISKNIIEMSKVSRLFTGNYPLGDPRTTVFIEDGRFHMQVRDKQYGLITGEPPPPKVAGVVNLYSREYFQLMKRRLDDTGVATYWLPLHSLTGGDAKAVIQAFCAAFEDCSLWSAGALELMLVGSKNGLPSVSAASLRQIWRSPFGEEFARLGYEVPAQLIAAFVADRDELLGLTAQTAPVTDNFPHRIRPSTVSLGYHSRFHAELVDTKRRSKAIRKSAYLHSLFPAHLIREASESMLAENMLTAMVYPSYAPTDYASSGRYWEQLLEALTQSNQRLLPQLALGINPWLVNAHDHADASWRKDPEYLRVLGLKLLAARDYAAAARRFSQSLLSDGFAPADRRVMFRSYLLSKVLAGEGEGIDWELRHRVDDPQTLSAYMNWLHEKFGLTLPPST